MGKVKRNTEFKLSKHLTSDIGKNVARGKVQVGKPRVDKGKILKYERGYPVNVKDVKMDFHKNKIAKKNQFITDVAKFAARTEILLTEESGFLEPDEGEISTQFSQSQIEKSVDLSSAAKRFDLFLNDFGPYRMSYTRNGRYLLLGGRKGHVAAMDWVAKKLLCEVNVMESVHDVAWLHQETLFAVAQKKWVYFYDNQGIEIHCVKSLDDVFKMLFLPYHFLLATVSNTSYMSWLDVSIGKMVEQFKVPSHGSVSSIALSPANALVCVGQTNGVVTFWTPNSKKPAVTKWCHKQPISALAFDPRGLTFATTSMDRCLKIWDARSLTGPLEEYHLRSAPQNLSFSHTGLLAVGTGNMVEVYKNNFVQSATEKTVYLRHRMTKTIGNMEFCPFEDVLGVAHSGGFTSLLVPGSGEPNFDALEVNPFQSKSQRKESEVHALLGKIPAELITFDSKELQKVHIPSLQDILETKKKLSHIKPPDIKFVPRKKSGKQRGSANAIKRKKIVNEENRRRYFKSVKETADESSKEEATVDKKPRSVLDRFKPKTKNR